MQIQRPGWVPVPKWIVDDRRISNGAFRFYCQISSACFNGNDTAWEAVTTYAKRMGTTPRTIRRWREELVNAGLIDFHGVEGRTNNYVLIHPRTPDTGVRPPRTSVSHEEEEAKKKNRLSPTTELSPRERKLRAC